MKTRWTWMLVLVLLCGCSACGDTGEGLEDARVDQLDPNKNPDGLRKLSFTSKQTRVDNVAMALSSDEKEIVTCSLGGKVAFYDATTLEERGLVDLAGETETPVDSYCRVSVIGEHAYVVYGDTPLTDPRYVIKLSAAGHKVEAVWKVDSSLYNLDGFGSSGSRYTGLVPLEGDRALAALGLLWDHSMPDDPEAGISALFADLKTGKLQRKQLLAQPKLKFDRIYTGFDGKKAVGTASFHTGGPQDYEFIIDVDTGELTRLSSRTYFQHFSVDEKSRLLLSQGLQVEGGLVFDLDTGKQVLAFPTPAGGFVVGAWLVPGGRLAGVVQSFPSGSESFVTLVELKSGTPVASAWIPLTFAVASRVSRDGRKIYVGSSEMAAEKYMLSVIEVPADL